MEEKRICPECGKEYSSRPALSRKDNKTMICPKCGMMEALDTVRNFYAPGMTDQQWKRYKEEYMLTIGAGQWYAGEAKELLYRIQRANPKLFKDMDNAGLEKDLLMKSWDTYAVTAESAKGKCIVDIISTDLGKKCQDQYMEDQIQTYIPIIERPRRFVKILYISVTFFSAVYPFIDRNTILSEDSIDHAERARTNWMYALIFPA